METLAIAHQDAIFIEVRGGRDLAISQTDMNGNSSTVVVRLTNVLELCEAMKEAALEA